MGRINKPYFSEIIPTFNRVNLIRDTFVSVLAET